MGDWDYADLADAHAEIKRLRKVMIEQFALYREEASAHRVCHDECDMAQAQAQAQIQAVRDVMNEWNAEADRIFAGEPHEPLYYGAAAEALMIALDGDSDE